MNTFKVGDIVRCKTTGDIGRVTGIEEDMWSWSNIYGFEQSPSVYLHIKYFDLPKRYSGLYCSGSFEHYKYPEKSDETLSDWMASPKQKLRNILARKQDKDTANWKKTKGMRMDGRNRR